MSSYGIWSLADTESVLTLSNKFKNDKVQTFMKQFFLTDEDVDAIKILFDKELENGLQNEGENKQSDTSSMTMNVTYFTELFNGTETGDYVTINLTAHNLVLVLAKVKPGFPVKTIRKYFTVDETVRRSPYIKIFEFLCECLLIFFKENTLLDKLQNLGFCTDFPMTQFGIDKAIINYFTATASEYPLNFYDIQKCFEIVLLEKRFKSVKFRLTAIMDVNMALLIHSCYAYGPLDVFLNFENDCNIIYQEQINRISKWTSDDWPHAKQVFIDTKLKNFGKSGTLNFIATSLDWSVILEPLSLTEEDKDCRLEKFLSQQYILELIRLILTSLHHELIYCRKGDIGELYKVNGISLTDLLNFLNAKDVKHALQLLPGGTVGIIDDDAEIAKYVCKVVFIRAALLISICLSRIFKRFQKDDFIVAIKFPLLEKYLEFEMYLRKFMGAFAPQKKMLVAKDDVYKDGAALATSIIKRQQSGMKRNL